MGPPTSARHRSGPSPAPGPPAPTPTLDHPPGGPTTFDEHLPGRPAAGASLRDEVRGDLASLADLKGVPYPSRRSLVDLLGLPGTWAVLGFRVARAAHRRGLPWLGELLRGVVTIAFGADLSPRAEVAPGLALPHPSGVSIRPDARVGRQARLMGNVRVGGGSYADPLGHAPAVVGDHCWLFDGAMVASGAIVGDRSVLGTNAVVVRPIEPDVIVIGDPARVVRHREPPGVGREGRV